MNYPRIVIHCYCLAIAAVWALRSNESQAALPLFNGTNLNGWHTLGGDATYHVENGEIVGTSAAPSSPNTFLVTDQTFNNFVLDVEFFISDPTFNSGIQLRSQSLQGHSNGRVFGYQVEIDPSDRSWSGGLYFEGGSPDRAAQWLDDLSDNQAAREAFQLGQWNYFRIVAEDRRIQTWINGVPAADYTDSDAQAFLDFGFIGLQVHQVSTPAVREVRWKNIVASSLPTLIVNRETGEVSLHNSMDLPVELQNYSIESASGSLDASDWTSLSDQGEPSWVESSFTTSRLAESNLGSSFSLLNDDTRSIGQAYNPTPVSFGSDYEDLQFQHTELNGATLSGRVEYVGQNTSNNLVLFIDPTTGQAVVKNTSPFTISLTGYTIASGSSSLASDTWHSLADQGQTGWNEAPGSAESLSELNPFDELVLAPGDRFNLGNIFDVNGDRDLALEFLLASGADFQIGAVLYRAAADFNFDGEVDADDLFLWKAAYGADGSADADGDGDSDGRDFMVWQRQVQQSALLAAASTSVPEPGGLLLAGVACMSYCGQRSGYRSVA
jgi:hypothetical protein